MSRKNTVPQHYYMSAALITYAREIDGKEVPKQRHMNAVMELPRKVITTSSINDVRMAMFQRMTEEAGVEPGAFRDITFLSFSYLGNMKPVDFYDMGELGPQSGQQH